MKAHNQCKWYDVCPMKIFYEKGAIQRKWVEDYCFGDNSKCKRYEMEEKGLYHPDNMMPDGSIDHGLS